MTIWIDQPVNIITDENGYKTWIRNNLYQVEGSTKDVRLKIMFAAFEAITEDTLIVRMLPKFNVHQILADLIPWDTTKSPRSLQ